MSDEKDENGNDVSEQATVLFVKALAARLQEDRGVIIHHDGKGYIVFKNVVNKTMGIQEDERFLTFEHGALVKTGVSEQMATHEVQQIEEPIEEVIDVVPGDPIRLSKN